MTRFYMFCNIKNTILTLFFLTIAQLTSGQNSNGNYRGYTNITEVIYSLGTQDVKIDNTIIEKSNSIEITTVNGYQFNRYLSIGLGIGIEKIENESFIPIFLDARMSFLQANVHPTLNANIGYTHDTDDLKNNSLFFNPSIGIRIDLTDKTSYLT